MITTLAMIAVGLWALVCLLIVKVVVPAGHVALLYRHGRLLRVLEPGRHYRPRVGTTWTFLDARLQILTITGQEVLSRDNLALKLSLAVQWRVVDAERSALAVQNVDSALRTAVQLGVRRVLSEHGLEQIVESRSAIGAELLAGLADEVASFGVELKSVELKDVTLPGELKRIFHEVVKAQQQGRAALERARGETAALRNLANAARLLEQTPALRDVRLLQAIEAEGGNTLVLGWAEGMPPIRTRPPNQSRPDDRAADPEGDA